MQRRVVGQIAMLLRPIGFGLVKYRTTAMSGCVFVTRLTDGLLVLQVTLLGYALDTFPQGFAKGDLQNALDGLEWGASCALIPASAMHQSLRLPRGPLNYYAAAVLLVIVPKVILDIVLRMGTFTLRRSSVREGRRYLVSAHSAPKPVRRGRRQQHTGLQLLRPGRRPLPSQLLSSPAPHPRDERGASHRSCPTFICSSGQLSRLVMQ